MSNYIFKIMFLVINYFIKIFSFHSAPFRVLKTDQWSELCGHLARILILLIDTVSFPVDRCPPWFNWFHRSVSADICFWLVSHLISLRPLCSVLQAQPMARGLLPSQMLFPIFLPCLNVSFLSNYTWKLSSCYWLLFEQRSPVDLFASMISLISFLLDSVAN